MTTIGFNNANWNVTYATAEDYVAWTGGAVPDNIDQLLRSASLLVREATSGAYYLSDDNGLPTDPAVVKAFTDATCAQAAAWAALKIDPLAGGALTLGVVVSKSLDGAGIGYADGKQAAQARAAAVIQLVPDAVRILDALHLTQTRVWTYG